MLVLVFFDEDSQHVHKRRERMILMFAHFVGELVEEFHKLVVFLFRMRKSTLQKWSVSIEGVPEPDSLACCLPVEDGFDR